ncbi:MAG: hypothetical protein JST15_09230 [Bacteroidetes bacterium]|nr:hypothetical protein [Bacteroidota bacterium]
MHKKNYKEEEFLKTNIHLLNKLNKLSLELKHNLTNDGKFQFVKDILNVKNFNSLFPKIKPNNLSNKNSKNEYKGIYAFGIVENKELFIKYIGVSKTIRRRFYSHTSSNSNSSSSWINLMLKKKYPDLKSLEKNKQWLKEAIKEIRLREIYSCRFAFLNINDNMLLHIAEVFCVNKLHSLYNSFETH